MKLKPRTLSLLQVLSLASMVSCVSLSSQALTFNLSPNSDMVGEVQTAVTKPGDSLAQVARDYDMGYTELEEANPNLDPDHIPAGSVIVIPSQFILPPGPRQGIVINLAEMRLYYYPKGRDTVMTFPIGIGREGQDATPTGSLKIVEHIANPTWHSPESIRIERAKDGVIIPKVVPPGPDNPLGNYAMRLSNMTYLIHGTNDPLGGIGRRSSGGCIRLYPEDIQQLFGATPNGTHVAIINTAYKAGWANNALYFESHVALEEKNNQAVDDKSQIQSIINRAAQSRPNATIDWNKVTSISGETQGLPQTVGKV
ncbi:MAG: L,D-transpeptidase family protein [Gammaproteobacteria bacterium]